MVNLRSRLALAACVGLCVGGVATGGAASWDDRQVVEAEALTIDPSNGLRVLEGVPFTGEARSYSQDGSLEKSDSYRDGLRHGHSRIWFPDGTLGFETDFVNGVRQGMSRTWWANGQRRSETTYHDGKQEGEAWVWYQTGEDYKRHNYHNGKPFGLQRAWRKNGKLYENFEVRGGRSYGLRNSKICFEVQDNGLGTEIPESGSER